MQINLVHINKNIMSSYKRNLDKYEDTIFHVDLKVLIKLGMSTTIIAPNTTTRNTTPNTPNNCDEGLSSLADIFFLIVEDKVLTSTVNSLRSSLAFTFASCNVIGSGVVRGVNVEHSQHVPDVEVSAASVVTSVVASVVASVVSES